MENVRTIYLDWNTGGIVRSDSGAYLARQYDHLSNLVVIRNAPGLENYYLIVEMKEDEDDLAARSMEPILLSGPYWLVPNVYTQLVQPVTFQVCCKTESGDFEQHSAKFKLNVVESLDHDGSAVDVDPSPMYDAYKGYVDDRIEELIDEAGDISVGTREYVDEKIQTMIAAAGDVAIDTTLSVSGAAADAKATGDAISETNERLDDVNSNVYTVKEDMYTAESPYSATVEAGTLNATNGTKVTYAYTVRTAYPQFIKGHFGLKLLNNGWRAAVYFYNNNGFSSNYFLGRETYTSANAKLIDITAERDTKYPTATYVGVVFFRWTGTNTDLTTEVTAEEISAFSNNCQFVTLSPAKERVDAVTENTRNLFLGYSLADIGKNDDGYFYATATTLNTKYKNSPGISKGIAFKENTRYRASLVAHTTGTSGTSGAGLKLIVHYTDGSTTSAVTWNNNVITDTRKSIVSNANKTVSWIGFEYSSTGGNTWYIKDIQIEEGVETTDYIEPLTAKDYVVRERVDKLSRNVTTLMDAPLNLFDKTQAIAGYKIKVSDGQGYADSNMYASAYIPVTPLCKYMCRAYYASSGAYGLAFYDADHVFVSGSVQSYNVGDGKPYIFVVPEGAVYVRISVYNTVLDSAYLYKYDEATFKKLSGAIEHDGRRFEIKPKITIGHIGYVPYGTYGRPQGGDIYGTKLFIFGDRLLKNFVYDMESFEIEAVAYTGESTNNHANNVSFGTVKYDDGDEYPIVYISNEKGPWCGVYRITGTSGSYELSEVSRISFPSGLSYPDLIIDNENKYAYLRCGINNELRMLRYNLPSSISTDVTLELAEYDAEQHPYGYLASYPIERRVLDSSGEAKYTQDAFISNEKCFALGGGEGNGNIHVYDLTDGKLLTFVDITSVINREPESCAVYNDKMVIVDYYGGVYMVDGY